MFTLFHPGTDYSARHRDRCAGAHIFHALRHLSNRAALLHQLTVVAGQARRAGADDQGPAHRQQLGLSRPGAGHMSIIE